METVLLQQLLDIPLVEAMRGHYETEEAVIEIENDLRELLTCNDFFTIADEKGLKCHKLYQALRRQVHEIKTAMA